MEHEISYKISYFQSSGFSSHENIKLIISNKRWVLDTNQIQAVWKYSTKKQPWMTCNTCYSLGWLTFDTTGLKDNANRIWMHPPRHNQYFLTEISPFPDFRKKSTVGSKYSSIIYFGSGLGIWSGKKSKNEYQIENMSIINGDSLWCINSKSSCNDISNSCFYIVDNKLGFIYIEYLFYNKDKLIMINKSVKHMSSIIDRLSANKREEGDTSMK
jgi:hypothetical protein